MNTPRELARVRTMAEITRLGWQHLESDGAAALSLRAIARDLGVVSSAIYRYVPSRDDLLTLLIAEGYRDLADAVERALEELGEATGRARWLTVSHAVRDWARSRPAAWALLYGSPVPGYSAPPEETTAQGTRVVLRLGAILADAFQRGQVSAVVGPLTDPGGIDEPLAMALQAIAVDLGQDVDAAGVAQVVIGWTSLIGAVTSEVFGQLGRDPFGAPDAFAALQLAAIADAVGLRAS